jgi:hypothetical protein
MKLLLAAGFALAMSGYVWVVKQHNVAPVDVGEPVLFLPGRIADLCRVAVLAPAGVALGCLGNILYNLWRTKHDQHDIFLNLLFVLSTLFVLSLLYIGIDIASRIDLDSGGLRYLTYRTPYGGVLFTASAVCLYIAMKRTRSMLIKAQMSDATIKITITDTHTPGPDIDLSSSGFVTPAPSSPPEK